MNQLQKTQDTPVKALTKMLDHMDVKSKFQQALKENSEQFIASIIEAYSNDKELQNCKPGDVIKECLKAAVLKLPISKGLGFAWIIAYKGIPSFQLGYKGYVQLAQRTGQYRFINADAVYEGELVKQDKLTGEIDLTGARISDTIIGYFAYIELLNGFKKVLYWSKDRVTEHAKRYSPSYNHPKGIWKTHFDAQAIKTMLKQVIGKYGVMSIEMAGAVESDEERLVPEYQAEEDIKTLANQGDVIDIPKQKAEKIEDGSNQINPEEWPEHEMVHPEPGF